MSVTNEQLATLLGDVAKRLTAIEDKLASGGGGGLEARAPAGTTDDDVSATTAEFDALVAKFGSAFKDLSMTLGEDAGVLVSYRAVHTHEFVMYSLCTNT